MKVGKGKSKKYWSASNGYLVGSYQPKSSLSFGNAFGTAAKTAATAAAGSWMLPAQIGLQAAQGVVGGIQAYQGSKKIKELESTRPSAGDITEYQKIAQMALDSDIYRKQQERADQMLATSIQASKTDPRGRAMLSGMLGASQAASDQFAMQQQQTQMQALAQLGGFKERKLAREDAIWNDKMAQAQQLQSAGIQNVASGVTGLVGSIADAQYLNAMKENPLLGLYAKHGGAMKTSGAFNHDTNPIDIIQQGEKIGEMTGGEVILNPKQQRAVASQSPYFRKLLKKFNQKS